MHQALARIVRFRTGTNEPAASFKKHELSMQTQLRKNVAEKGSEMKKALCILVLTVGTLSPAVAQGPQCGPKLEVATQLAQRFGEVPIASGIAFNNSMKFFGNPKTGSWSLIFIRPDGMACVLAAGEDLEVSSLAYAQSTTWPSF